MTGARKGRVDGLEMRDDRIGRTTKDAGALEIVPELGEWELKRADEPPSAGRHLKPTNLRDRTLGLISCRNLVIVRLLRIALSPEGRGVGSPYPFPVGERADRACCRSLA